MEREKGRRRPFAAWSTPKGGLDWYRRYNRAKHNRHRFFCLASFDALIDACRGSPRSSLHNFTKKTIHLTTRA